MALAILLRERTDISNTKQKSLVVKIRRTGKRTPTKHLLNPPRCKNAALKRIDRSRSLTRRWKKKKRPDVKVPFL